MFILGKEVAFPPVEKADDNGIVAVGGDLSTQRLLFAYRCGIFPWYNEGEPITWWSPDPRFILLPGNLKISKSMQSVLRSGCYHFTINKAFTQVIQQCKTINRKGQQGTWITPAVQQAYITLHKLGFAHSAEAWLRDELVGGLYGIRMGNVFFGESMFSKKSNASKFAFIKYVEQLHKEGVKLIDCQVYTEHLESLGAGMITRIEFIDLLKRYIQ